MGKTFVLRYGAFLFAVTRNVRAVFCPDQEILSNLSEEGVWYLVKDGVVTVEMPGEPDTYFDPLWLKPFSCKKWMEYGLENRFCMGMLGPFQVSYPLSKKTAGVFLESEDKWLSFPQSF